MEIEIWKDIPLLNSNYEASNYGKIRHRKFKKVLQPNVDRYGYEYIGISISGVAKSFKVHRLVCYAFIGVSDMQVDHINNNKLDNKLSNLRYCTAIDNVQKARALKFTNIQNINFHKQKKKFIARITIKGKRIQIGAFTTQEEAIEAYKNYKNK